MNRLFANLKAVTNTYLQLYIHFIFAVKRRTNLIPKMHQDELYQYITGIVTNKKQKLLAIGGMPDHLHLFVVSGMRLRNSRNTSCSTGFGNCAALHSRNNYF